MVHPETLAYGAKHGLELERIVAAGFPRRFDHLRNKSKSVRMRPVSAGGYSGPTLQHALSACFYGHRAQP